MTKPLPAAAPPARRILAATVAALLVAAVVLVVAVLPAEYGLDPTGVGAAMGLTALAGAEGVPGVRTDGLSAQVAPYRSDARVFELSPEEELEYKYRLEAGAGMIFAWQVAGGAVRAEMHSEADGAPEGVAEFFEIQETTTRGRGTYVAPFPGIHGWYWKNLGPNPVTLTLDTTGFYDHAVEYRAGQPPVERAVSSLPSRP